MKDWTNLVADEDRILTKHYTPGRAGRRIDKVVLHHNAGNLSINDCWRVWQTREASAHYQVDASGRVGQLVWDADTAWHAGDLEANRTSIGIEHADASSSPWRISDATLDAGAHLTAAVCRFYGLGRPQWLSNVFPHSRFSSTACPCSISGSQNAEYMARAQHWYDEMTGQATPSAPQSGQDSAGRLAVDGSCGPATVRRWQTVMGTSVDGVISGQLVPDQKTYRRPNLDDSAVSYGGYGSELVRAVQRRLGGLDADGLLGPATIKAVQAHYGLTQDASFGPATVKALQTALNAGRF